MGDHQPAPKTDASEARPPGLRDHGVLALLLLVIALQGISWGLLEGYQLADSVEYMERARAFIRTEEVIDSRQIRSFGFSTLLLPIFGAAELFGVRDYRAVVWIVRCLQMAIGLALVLSCMRIGWRLGGRNTGLAAGLLVGVNPVFLQYSVAPLADVMAALCVALAVEHLSTPTDRRGGLRAGLWLGLGLLMAYKTLPIAAVLVGLVVVRDRRRGLASLGGVLLGYLSCVGVQVILDKVVYGRWGSSLFAYFGENAVGIVGRLLYMVGQVPLGKRLFAWYYELEGGTAAVGDTLRQVQPADWYWTHLGELLVWPVLAIAVLALLRCVKQGNWRSSLLLGALAVNVALLSQKGSKEFRLWLPLLPLMGPLLGWGWAWIADARPGRTRPAWRAGLAFVLLALAVGLGGRSLTTRNTRRNADYWRAIAYVAERAAEEREANPAAPPMRVAAAYHWAVFLQTSADLHLTKLPRQVTGWTQFEEKDRFRVFDTLRTQDWFLVHGPVLTNLGNRELTYRINAWFDVEEVFWDREAAEDLGPIYVMRRRKSEESDPERRALFEVQPDGDPAELRRRLGFEEPVRLMRPALGEELWFMGSTYESLPADGMGWITYYYHCATPCLADYDIVDRISSRDEGTSWRNNHKPTYGVFRTNQWEPGWLVRESWPVVAAVDHDDWTKPLRPIGGPYRRGDFIPAYLWMDLATFYWLCVHCDLPLFPEDGSTHVCDGQPRGAEDGRVGVSGRLERAKFGEDGPLRRGPLKAVAETPNGWRFSPDGLNLVQRFLLPVQPSARVPDDGRVLQE
jgi:hypothetical protein